MAPPQMKRTLDQINPHKLSVDAFRKQDLSTKRSLRTMSVRV